MAKLKKVKVYDSANHICCACELKEAKNNPKFQTNLWFKRYIGVNSKGEITSITRDSKFVGSAFLCFQCGETSYSLKEVE